MAWGVLPPGLVHNPFLAIASIITLQFSGSLLAARTCAAASSAPTFFVLGSLAFLGVVFGLLAAFFVVLFFDLGNDLRYSPAKSGCQHPLVDLRPCDEHYGGRLLSAIGR